MTNHSSRFTGKFAVITGAGSGIGRAIALYLAREGAETMRIFLAILLLSSCALFAQTQSAERPLLPILPIPKSCIPDQGSLVLTRETSITLGAGAERIGKYFAQRLSRGTGWPVPVVANGTLRFEIAPLSDPSPEAYFLQVASDHVTLRGASPMGLARGAETLLQLMPPEVYGPGRMESVTLPQLTIQDAPRFAWRALMLDVSRHFESKEYILKFLDGLAASKMSVFQWHLTDDQGWRLPIEGYPKLTEKGPAYSREDIHEIVEHAADLGITIVPEIDVPGHSQAARDAYPEIGCRDTEGKPCGPMNPGADETYVFLDAVIADVARQFPESPTIHIGADEVGVGPWNDDPQCQALMKRAYQLYPYFINRLVAIVEKHGRQPIAWEEAYTKETDPTLQYIGWRRDMHACISLPKAGRDVVMSPENVLYFDHCNSRSKDNFPGYGNNTSNLNIVYFFEPDSTALTPEERRHVLGGQGSLWGERIRSPEHAFKMAFPRVAALSECLWSPREKLNWESFLARLAVQRRRYDAMGIPYFWETDSLAVTLGGWQAGDLARNNGVIEIPLDGKITQAGLAEFLAFYGAGEGQFRIKSMEILRNGQLISRSVHDDDATIFNEYAHFYMLSIPDTAAHYTLRIRAEQLHGDCSAIVQMIPALAPDRYSPRQGPASDINGARQDNLTRGQPASASQSAVNHTAGMAVDGNNGTSWASGPAQTAWLGTDLGLVQTVHSVRVNWDTDCASQYAVDISLDGKSWTRVFTGQGKPGATEAMFDPVSARFIKIVCLDPATSSGFAIRELEGN